MSCIFKCHLGRSPSIVLALAALLFAESCLAMPANRPNQIVSRRGFEQPAIYGIRQRSAFKRFISNAASSLGRLVALKFNAPGGGLFFVRRTPARSFTGIVSARPISRAIFVPNIALRRFRVARVSYSRRNLSNVAFRSQWYGFQRGASSSNLSRVRTATYSPRLLSNVRGSISGPRLYRIRSTSLTSSQIYGVRISSSPRRLSNVRGNLNSQRVISKVRGGYSNRRLTQVRNFRF